MRPVLLFCTLLLFAVPSQAEAQQPPAPAASAIPTPRVWQGATGAEGSYTVQFPGKPAERQVNLKDARGAIATSRLQEVNLDGGKTYFGMVWTRVVVPPSPAELDKMFTRVRDQTTAALQGALITTRPLKQNGFSGLDYVIQAGPDATRFRYRTFLVGNRMIQQVYSGITGTENSADVRKFHDSLKLKQ